MNVGQQLLRNFIRPNLPDGLNWDDVKFAPADEAKRRELGDRSQVLIDVAWEAHRIMWEKAFDGADDAELIDLCKEWIKKFRVWHPVFLELTLHLRASERRALDAIDRDRRHGEAKP